MPVWRMEYRSVVFMGMIFVATILLAMFLSVHFVGMGYQAFEDPDSLWIPVIYTVFILAFSGVVLFLAKKRKLGFIQGFVLLACGMALMYVFAVPYGYLFDLLIDPYYAYTHIEMLSYIFLALCMASAAALTYVLYKYPEWYVVNAVGILVGAGIIALLGISLGILPIFILMIVLAIYDAISVYKTKHMIDLADAVIEKRLPVVLVVPKTKTYSLRKQKSLKKTLKAGGKREAMFMGLGDVVFPGILVVSAMTFLGGEFGPTAASLGVALATLAGSLVGYAILMSFVMKGRPQAGLPLLNSGAILGFAVGYFLIFRSLGMGVW